MNVRYDTAKNWHISSNISRHTGPIFTIFSPYESTLHADYGTVAYFPIVKGRCHGNQIMLQKCYKRRPIPLVFVELVLENELQYHGLAVCINTGDDGATSSKNFVKFSPVTPELTELICELLARHGKNWRI